MKETVGRISIAETEKSAIENGPGEVNFRKKILKMPDKGIFP